MLHILHFHGISLTEYDCLWLRLLLHNLLLGLKVHLLELSDGWASRRRGDEDLLLRLLNLSLRLLVKLEDLNLRRLRLRFGVKLRLELLLVEGGRCDRVEDAADGERVRHGVQLLLLLLLLFVRLLKEELVLDGDSLGLITRW